MAPTCTAVSGRYAANHSEVQLESALEGFGMASLPEFAARAHLHSDALVRALQGWLPFQPWVKFLGSRRRYGESAKSTPMTSPIEPSFYSFAPLNSTSAMLLAAGRGERMQPLTDHTPKPLLTVQGKPLMQWHLEALARGGFNNVVVNTAWLGDQIADKYSSIFSPEPSSDGLNPLSNKEQFTASVHIQYSHEGRDFGGALETTGGIARALPLLCPSQANGVFWVLAGDVFAPDFVFHQADVDRFLAGGKLAHLWLVPNPAHNPRGDFGLATTADNADGVRLALNLPDDDPQPRYTYSTIGLYRAALFAQPWCDIPQGNPQGVKAALVHLLRAGMARQKITAQLYSGRWTDVGTPERLAQLNSAQT